MLTRFMKFTVTSRNLLTPLQEDSKTSRKSKILWLMKVVKERLGTIVSNKRLKMSRMSLNPS
jgi:hypothetical protein